MKTASILLSALAAVSAIRSLYLLGAGSPAPAAATLIMAVAFAAAAYVAVMRSGGEGTR